MASCVRNIYTKNYQDLIIYFQVTVENVGHAFLGHSVFSDSRPLLQTTCTIPAQNVWQ